MEDKTKDGGYAWVIVISCALTTSFFKGGQFGTMGVLFVEWMDYFRLPYSSLTSLSALFYCTGNFLAPLISVAIKLHGSRWCAIVCSVLLTISYTVCAYVPTLPVLYVFFGIVAGCAFSGLHLAGEVITQQYFDKHRGLAVGILTTFSGIGVLVFPLLNTYLISLYSWQGALLIQGAILANGAVGGALLRPYPGTNSFNYGRSFCGELKASLKYLDLREWKNVKASQKKSFLFYLAGIVLSMFGYQLSLVYSPKRAVQYGISHERAALLVSVIGFFAPTRLLFGWFGDRPWVSRLLVMMVCCVTGGLANALSVIRNSFVYLITLQVVQAISAAGIMAVMPAVLVDILGTDLVVVASGYYIFTHGSANLLVHLAAGPVIQYLGMNTLFLIFGICQIIGGIWYFLSYYILRNSNRSLVTL